MSESGEADSALWRYVAETPAGDTRRGEIAAASEAAAAAALRSEGLQPVRLTRAGGAPRISGRGARLDAATHARLMRSLADLVGAAIPVRDALSALARRETRPRAQAFLNRLAARVEAGDSLAAALAADPSGPPRLAAAMAGAGEQSGRLGPALDTLAGELEAGAELRQELLGQLLYPAFVVALFFATLLALSYFVLPSFEPLFRDAAGTTPPETALVLAVGAFIRAWGPLVLIAALVTVLAAGRVFAVRPELAGALADRLVFIGRVRAFLDAARYARVLALLLENGRTLARAEPTARALVASADRRARLERAAAAMRTGAAPGAALRAEAALPEEMIDFFELGERTGALAKLLNRAARLYDLRARRAVKRAVDLTGPALIALLGVVIAGFIAAVMSGVLSLNEVVY
jgi:type II secretory pathway component PulF